MTSTGATQRAGSRPHHDGAHDTETVMRLVTGAQCSDLEVLDTERELFAAELTLAQAQLAERLAVVRLYKALGGWQL
jgi:hypothetical protein